MKILQHPTRTAWIAALERPAIDHRDLETKVAAILADVQQRGDTAVQDWTAKFDGVQLKDPSVTPDAFDWADAQLDSSLKEAIRVAATNIERFHRMQVLKEPVVETMPGVMCWRKQVPIERVGLYIPGGSAPLFSTVLMLGIPAAIAGCQEIILCTPPGKDGKVHPAILYAARLAGITKVFAVGGVQAIGAMAYGTATIPSVYKIFGPGNQYVTAAKQVVSRQGVAIDMPAGPSEVMVVADDTAYPQFVSADLLSQAEHGPDSQVVLLTTAADLIPRVLEHIEIQLATLPRADIARQALANSVAIVAADEAQLADIANYYAAEHLILAMDAPLPFAEKITNAGSVFLGHYSPESVGDYASGTNHTLPTNGYARMYSGVSLDAFVKKITYQQLTPGGIREIGRHVALMASAESLEAHRLAVEVRLDHLSKQDQP